MSLGHDRRSGDPPGCGGGHLRAWARAAFALDLRSLAAYRMLLGGLLVADCLLRTRDFRLMHTATGMFTPDAVRAHAGRAACWSLALVSDADAWAAGLLALEGALGLLLVVGLWSRVTTVAAWVTVVSIVRRTAPATNAGDAWLICQLFWCCFLPLGACWSWDRWRRPTTWTAWAPGIRAWSVATVALGLQLVLVYLAAGIGKRSETWRSGTALGYVLSVHDHGSQVGAALGDIAWLTRPLTWLVPGFEVIGAILFLALPTVRVRGLLITAFLLFHAAIWGMMSVGLFAPIAMVAWLPFVPSNWWDRAGWRVQPARIRADVEGEGAFVGLAWPASVACGTALALALAGWGLVTVRPTHGAPAMPVAVDLLLDLTGLHQEWQMFDDVPAQEQWVASRAVLADGQIVDLLHGGRPATAGPPHEGFLALPHHRWQKLFWVLHKPGMRCFAPGVAAGLVRRWNATHGAGEHVLSLEIRFGRRSLVAADGTFHELLIATWPPRTATGAGGLDRFLEEAGAASASLGRVDLH